MTISINNPVQSTIIFIAIFLIAVFIFVRRKKVGELFPVSLTQELKGLAILAVIFSHIGYFLVTDHRFLYPLSTIAGVGVDLFLFLSGLGLVASSFKNKLPVWQFYKNQLLKLFTPFWMTLIFFLLLDFFVLKIIYPWQFVAKSFLGIFTSADLYQDIDSPLWYFTLILFYYLVFPLLFSKKRPWLSAMIIYVITYLIVRQNPVWLENVIPFYKLHIIAFPLGIFSGWLLFRSIQWPAWITNIINKIKKFGSSKTLKRGLKSAGHYFLIILLVIIAGYLAYHTGSLASSNKAQLISIATMSVIIILFILKNIEFKLLYWFGFYSYEIYLFHWPFLYRYDIFYKYLPAWLATIFYLILFVGLAWGLKNLSKIILERLTPKI